MKYILFIVFILTVGNAYSQMQSKIRSRNDTVKKYQNAHAPVIAAKDAYRYIGRMVIVKDSLYSGTIINDTTLACAMGEKMNTPRLTLFFTDKIDKHTDKRFFNTFRRFRVTIWGTITGTKEAPILILRNPSNFTFDEKAHSRP